MFDLTYLFFLLIVVAVLLIPFAILVKPGVSRAFRAVGLLLILPLIALRSGVEEARRRYELMFDVPLGAYGALLALLALNLSIICCGLLTLPYTVARVFVAIAVFLLLLHAVLSRRRTLY